MKPAFKAYISLTMGWILIKLSENVGILVRLIVLNFIALSCWGFAHSLCAKRVMGQRGKFFLHFYAFQSISCRLRHTFSFLNFCECEAQNTLERSKKDASAIMLHQTVTLATAIFLYTSMQLTLVL